MAYETKVLLVAVANIMRMSNGDMKTAYNAVAEMANAEGVVIEPYDEAVKNMSKSDD